MPDTGGAEIGDAVRVRIRARDVSVALGPVAGLSIRNRVAARITGIETDEGAFAEILLNCGGQNLRARISRMAVAELSLEPGMDVSALVKSIAFDRRFARPDT